MHMGLDGALVCIWVSRAFIIILFWTPDQHRVCLVIIWTVMMMTRVIIT